MIRKHKWEEAEQAIAERMAPHIEQHELVAAEIEDVAFEMLSGIKPGGEATLYRVHTALIVRVLQDLRSVVLVVRHGYTMQASALAAGAFESANTLGYVGKDLARAKRWLEHNDLRQTPWATRATVYGTMAFLEVGATPEEWQESADKEYKLYRHLCVAKHANPVAERSRYLVERGNVLQLALTPVYSDRRIREAKLSLALALRSALLAIWTFHKAHRDQITLAEDRVSGLAEKVVPLVTNWREEIEETHEQRRGDVTQ